MDKVWQGLLSAPKIKRYGQAYIYVVKIFSSPEQAEFIYPASCKWCPDEPFAPVFHKLFLSAWHVPYLWEAAC